MGIARGAVGGTNRRSIASALRVKIPQRNGAFQSMRQLEEIAGSPQRIDLAIFGDGGDGVWYDPSDLSTLFQDVYGVVPVTGLGQPVGLMLDKRFPNPSFQVDTSVELITNGTFDADANWTKGTGWSISGGVATKVASASTSNLTQSGSVPFVGGNLYVVSATISNYVAGTLTFLFTGGTGNVTVGSISGNGTFFGVATALQGNVNFIAQGTNTFAGDLDNVSVRPATLSPGNHIFATTSTTRPTLEARSNRLIETELFNGAAWSPSNVTVAQDIGDVAAPDGTLTAATLTATANNATIGQAYLVPLTRSYVFSVWLRRRTGTGTIEIQNGNGTYSSVAVTASWQRFSVAGSVTAGTRSPTIRIVVSGDAVDAWGAQLETGSDAAQYQRVVNAGNYTDIGLPRYLRFDGIDDFMSVIPAQTPAWGGTNGLTVGLASVQEGSSTAPAGVGHAFGLSEGINYFAFRYSARPVDLTYSIEYRTSTANKQGAQPNFTIYTPPNLTTQLPFVSVCVLYGEEPKARAVNSFARNILLSFPSVIDLSPLGNATIRFACNTTTGVWHFYGGVIVKRAITDVEIDDIVYPWLARQAQVQI